MKTTYTLLFLLATSVAFAQSTTLTPGTALPSMTTAQRTAMVNPTNGTLVFDTNAQSYWYRQSGVWVELPKAGSTANYWQLTGLAGNEIKNTNSGGFWSANPTTLTVNSDNTSNPPTVPVEGAGTRLMWIPSRSAFRVGTVSSDNATSWSATNVGLFSFASGFNNQASGKFSTAMGIYGKATGELSTAIGSYATADGLASTALGFNTTASGEYAIASGFGTIATGIASTAIGFISKATGGYSAAIGFDVVASGQYSTAMGVEVNTNGNEGTFMIGDSDPLNQGVTFGGAADQFVGRFYNGYYLITSGNSNRTGAHMLNGQSSWSAISDSTRKEKIVLADGESFLLKLRNLRLGSWNYKKQGAKPERFYGPMAQEIFAAFGKDKYGTIGNDTTVSTLNMDGLLFIFSQALEKRTQDLKAYAQSLEKRTEVLEAENRQLKIFMQKLEARLENLESTSQTAGKEYPISDK
ncbi:tail fiber domain-containing protein [Emticicia sp. C21]|uniref:tail fiber domain-containing protein n=1 Tax=Emticicia sp. C21 TaxID=2302915 RepID=UPI000E34B3E4|nr:tail fiber domain-containing protein [Emticicia sp. C21]RFS13321.1 hypothetical protein D0T08_27150 [Emticicia sp. C21]